MVGRWLKSKIYTVNTATVNPNRERAAKNFLQLNTRIGKWGDGNINKRRVQCLCFAFTMIENSAKSKQNRPWNRGKHSLSFFTWSKRIIYWTNLKWNNHNEIRPLQNAWVNAKRLEGGNRARKREERKRGSEKGRKKRGNECKKRENTLKPNGWDVRIENNKFEDLSWIESGH